MTDIQKSLNNASYVYSIGMLRLLLDMEYITPEEFDRISAISADHYGTDIFCV